MMPKRMLALVLGLCTAVHAGASPWIWDNDGDGVDDRFAAVALNGLSAAYTGNDPVHGMLRFQVAVAGSLTTFGAYVDYDHLPTAADIAAVQATGAHVTHSYHNFRVLRVTALYPQIGALRALPGVTRVETIQALQPMLDVSARGCRARASEDDALFPSVWKDLGLDGTGVVLAILDTGVNDSVDLVNPLYPGHESLAGRCLGGGDFSFGDSLLNRPNINAQDHGTGYHGTHVAGIALGSGGPSGIQRGIAPGARFVDCKVLTDAGSGFGLLDALDWVVDKRDTLWLGVGSPQWRGIQVLNLSLGGLDNSDGQDADAQALNSLASYGILSAVAVGNNGRAGYVPSPASADSAISVAAVRDRNSVRRDDDVVDTDYSNRGPRPDDGDAGHFDELRPLVSAPGTDIVSADGNPSTNGTQYVSRTGTSMAAPHAAGLLALLRQARPGLGSGEAMRILSFTSEHHGPADDPFGGPGHPDPAWNSAWGYGEMDAYAAVLEALNPAATQIVRIQALPRAGSRAVRLKWLTQREVGAVGFHVYRSLDSLAGYVRINAVLLPAVGVPAPVGDSAHAFASNRTLYSWLDPGRALGQKYFYRVSWLDGAAVEHFSPPIRVWMPATAPPVTVRSVYTHDDPDRDLAVRVGLGSNFANPDWSMALAGTDDADSVFLGTGLSLLGTRRWIFQTDLHASFDMPSFPLPGPARPWFLAGTEGGCNCTRGALNALRVTFHDFGGSGLDSVFNSLSPTVPTSEGVASYLSIPYPLPVATPGLSDVRLRVSLANASPVLGTCTLRYSLPRSGPMRLSVIDPAGREAAVVAVGAGETGEHVVRFDSLRSNGSRLPSGMYWARLVQGDQSACCRLILLR